MVLDIGSSGKVMRGGVNCQFHLRVDCATLFSTVIGVLKTVVTSSGSIGIYLGGGSRLAQTAAVRRLAG